LEGKPYGSVQDQIDQANHENSSLRIQSHGVKDFTC
jgi:hypothetical protein